MSEAWTPGASWSAAEDSAAAESHTVRCPICLDTFSWDDLNLFSRSPDGRTYTALNLHLISDPLKRADRMLDAWKLCPNPSKDARAQHYLPAAYARFGPPLVIGLVGFSGSGKTHLLAAIIGEMERGGLGQLGLRVEAVDIGMHRGYLEEHVEILFDQGQAIPRTRRYGSDDEVYFIDAILIDNNGTKRAVAFFDVSGEDLANTTRSMQFVLALDALLFVVDPDRALRRDSVVGRGGRPAVGDRTFDAVLRRVSGQPDFDVPVAIVITKCDRYRFTPSVSKWMRRDALAAFGPNGVVADITAESKDAYAFLYQHGAHPYLRPVAEFRQATLHFVSATGSDSRSELRDGEAIEVFRRSVRPRRVLDPLVAILAMTGMFGKADSMVGM